MIIEVTVETLRRMATEAGLTLNDEELRKLLPNVNRARNQATELREIIDAAAEPALTFTVARLTK